MQVRRTLRSMVAVVALSSATVAVSAKAAAQMPAHLQSVLETSPIASPRSEGMGGASVTSADNLDAAFENPAGIGGALAPEARTSVPLIRKLYFPELNVEANQNSSQLFQQLKQSGAQSSAAVGQTVLDDNANKREYARAGIASGIVVGRAMVVPFEDLQVAATPRGDGSGLTDLNYRNMSGIGVGFSAQDPSGHLSLGYFGYEATRTDTSGSFTYDQFDQPSQRSAALKDTTETTRGFGSNAGLMWQVANQGSPTLGLNVRNVGGTYFHGGGETVVDPQAVDFGFSVAPRLGKTGILTLSVQADDLTNKGQNFTKKYRIGSELALGGMGSYASAALRAGYNEAGASGGLCLSFGLIGVEAATYAVDTATDNSRDSERRTSVTVLVNVASF